VEENYLELNRANWNERVDVHAASAFYDVEAFLQGKSSLNPIELELLGEINGKSILHLQCHFGQDSISLARMGASVVGIDLSDKAIAKAKELAKQTKADALFHCCDVYSTRAHVAGEFDIVFSSYGTIGWLPDLQAWATIISESLKPGGFFVFAEFHPFIWMYDNDFTRIAYKYFKDEAIIENEISTYTDGKGISNAKTISWNHGLAEVMQSLIDSGLTIEVFKEYDYSPYGCFNHTEAYDPGKFRIKPFANHVPLVYALKAVKKPVVR